MDAKHKTYKISFENGVGANQDPAKFEFCAMIDGAKIFNKSLKQVKSETILEDNPGENNYIFRFRSKNYFYNVKRDWVTNFENSKDVLYYTEAGSGAHVIYLDTVNKLGIERPIGSLILKENTLGSGTLTATPSVGNGSYGPSVRRFYKIVYEYESGYGSVSGTTVVDTPSTPGNYGINLSWQVLDKSINVLIFAGESLGFEYLIAKLPVGRKKMIDTGNLIMQTQKASDFEQSSMVSYLYTNVKEIDSVLYESGPSSPTKTIKKLGSIELSFPNQVDIFTETLASLTGTVYDSTLVSLEQIDKIVQIPTIPTAIYINNVLGGSRAYITAEAPGMFKDVSIGVTFDKRYYIDSATLVNIGTPPASGLDALGKYLNTIVIETAINRRIANVDYNSDTNTTLLTMDALPSGVSAYPFKVGDKVLIYHLFRARAIGQVSNRKTRVYEIIYADGLTIGFKGNLIDTIAMNLPPVMMMLCNVVATVPGTNVASTTGYSNMTYLNKLTRLTNVVTSNGITALITTIDLAYDPDATYLHLPSSGAIGHETRIDIFEAGNAGSFKYKRLYRSVPGGYALLAEVPFETPTFMDDLSDSNLQYALPTVTYFEGTMIAQEPPPIDLRGLCVHSNSLWGISGGSVFHSFKGLYHAWSGIYSFDIPYPPLKLVSFGQTLWIFTTAGIHRIDGNDPSNYTLNKVPNVDGVLAPDTIVSTTDKGILYVSRRGLMAFNGVSSICLSEGVIDPQYWTETSFAAVPNQDGKLEPLSSHNYSAWCADDGIPRWLKDALSNVSTASNPNINFDMQAFYHAGCYYVYWNNKSGNYGTHTMLCFNLNNGCVLTTLPYRPKHVFVDEYSKVFAILNEPVEEQVHVWTRIDNPTLNEIINMNDFDIFPFAHSVSDVPDYYSSPLAKLSLVPDQGRKTVIMGKSGSQMKAATVRSSYKTVTENDFEKTYGMQILQAAQSGPGSVNNFSFNYILKNSFKTFENLFKLNSVSVDQITVVNPDANFDIRIGSSMNDRGWPVVEYYDDDLTSNLMQYKNMRIFLDRGFIIEGSNPDFENNIYHKHYISGMSDSSISLSKTTISKATGPIIKNFEIMYVLAKGVDGVYSPAYANRGFKFSQMLTESTAMYTEWCTPGNYKTISSPNGWSITMETSVTSYSYENRFLLRWVRSYNNKLYSAKFNYVDQLLRVRHGNYNFNFKMSICESYPYYMYSVLDRDQPSSVSETLPRLRSLQNKGFDKLSNYLEVYDVPYRNNVFELDKHVESPNGWFLLCKDASIYHRPTLGDTREVPVFDGVSTGHRFVALSRDLKLQTPLYSYKRVGCLISTTALGCPYTNMYIDPGPSSETYTVRYDLKISHPALWDIWNDSHQSLISKGRCIFSTTDNNNSNKYFTIFNENHSAPGPINSNDTVGAHTPDSIYAADFTIGVAQPGDPNFNEETQPFWVYAERGVDYGVYKLNNIKIFEVPSRGMNAKPREFSADGGTILELLYYLVGTNSMGQKELWVSRALYPGYVAVSENIMS